MGTKSRFAYLCNFSDFTLECAVINENFGAKHDSFSQLSVSSGHTSAVSFDGRIDNDLELLAFL